MFIRRTRRSMAILVLLAACQSGSTASSSGSGAAAKQAERGSAAPTAPAPTRSAPAVVSPLTGDALKQYTADIERLCNAEKLSGALDQPEDARPMLVAQWLGKNLETTQVHEFLVHIQPLGPTDKADVLDGEAHRLGLDGCALSAVWKAEAAKKAAPTAP